MVLPQPIDLVSVLGDSPSSRFELATTTRRVGGYGGMSGILFGWYGGRLPTRYAHPAIARGRALSFQCMVVLEALELVVWDAEVFLVRRR